MSAASHGLVFVTGRRRSGKSAYFEREMMRFEHRIYVGTLPRVDDTYSMIQEHKERRGPGWTLIEIAEDESVTDHVESAISSLGPGCACLIDGLMNWVAFRSAKHGDLFSAALGVGRALAFIVDDNPSVTWRLLDVPPETYEEEGQPIAAMACALLHRTLRTEISGLCSFVYEDERFHEYVQSGMG